MTINFVKSSIQKPFILFLKILKSFFSVYPCLRMEKDRQIQEDEYIPQLDALTGKQVQIEQGYAVAPMEPGIGIDWDWDAIRATQRTHVSIDARAAAW